MFLRIKNVLISLSDVVGVYPLRGPKIYDLTVLLRNGESVRIHLDTAGEMERAFELMTDRLKAETLDLYAGEYQQ